jgi:hypothetical protein
MCVRFILLCIADREPKVLDSLSLLYFLCVSVASVADANRHRHLRSQCFQSRLLPLAMEADFRHMVKGGRRVWKVIRRESSLTVMIAAPETCR